MNISHLSTMNISHLSTMNISFISQQWTPVSSLNDEHQSPLKDEHQCHLSTMNISVISKRWTSVLPLNNEYQFYLSTMNINFIFQRWTSVLPRNDEHQCHRMTDVTRLKSSTHDGHSTRCTWHQNTHLLYYANNQWWCGSEYCLSSTDPKAIKRLKRTLFNQTKREKVRIFGENLVFKATYDTKQTNKQKTVHLSFASWILAEGREHESDVLKSLQRTADTLPTGTSFTSIWLM